MYDCTVVPTKPALWFSTLVYIYHGCFCLFRYFLEQSNSANLTLKRAKEQFPIEISTAWMTWVLISGRCSSCELYVSPSLHHPCRRGRGSGPSDSPRKRCRCCDIYWLGRNPWHQVGTTSLGKTVWIILMGVFLYLKDLSGGNVTHPPPNSD